jgi:DNA-binding NarL/FixJ family response regulator
MVKRQGLKLMLVEDDELTRATIKSALIQEGFEILFDTASVKTAIECVKLYNPDVAVLDYNLGKGPNGIDLAKKIRESNPGIGIVLLTAFLNPNQIEEKILQLPPGSKYLVKHSVTKIGTLVNVINEAASFEAV